jgi:hypothetical protein
MHAAAGVEYEGRMFDSASSLAAAVLQEARGDD